MYQPLTSARHLGVILRAQRKAKGLSQRDMAARLGVSQGRYSVLEADPSTMSLERMLTAAAIVGIRVAIGERVEPRERGKRAVEW